MCSSYYNFEDRGRTVQKFTLKTFLKGATGRKEGEGGPVRPDPGELEATAGITRWQRHLGSKVKMSGKDERKERKQVPLPSPLRFFLDCSLLACVELGLRGHLMAALEWLGPGGGGGQEEGGGCPWVERENHECLLRACHGGDGEAAAALRAKGFSVRRWLKK